MIKKYAPAAIYLLLSLAILLPLLGPGYFLALDMQWGPNSFAEWNFGDFYGFSPSSYGAYFPVNMALAAISQVIGVEMAEKLFLMAILFLCGACAHYSLPKEHGNARYFAGLLYMLNPFVFSRFLAGHWSLLLSYALWPLALGMFSEFLEKPNERRLLANAALITSLAAVSSHGVLMLLLAYALKSAFHFLKNGFQRPAIIGLAALGALVLALNLYWIAPTVLLFGDTYSPSSASAYLEDYRPLSEGMSLGATLATMHGFWRFGFVFTKDAVPQTLLLFLPIAFIVLAGFVHLLREKAFTALLCLLIFAAGFLLAMGDASPISFIFTMLGDKLPLYFIFRDSHKFVGLICLAYSILGSYGVHTLASGRKKHGNALLIALIILPLLYNFGFFGFFGQIRLTQYPSDWADAEAIISADPLQSRILVLPPWLYNHYGWANNTQKTLAMPARDFFSKPAISERAPQTEHSGRDVSDPSGSYFGYIFENRQYINNTAALLAPLNVRYVMLLKGSDYSDLYLWLFKRKGGTTNGTTLAYESESIYIFRNDLAPGPFFTTDDNGSGSFKGLVESGAFPASGVVIYTKTTPASYEIASCGGKYLVFASPPNRYLSFEGQQPSSWHGIANVFPCFGPGTLVNSLFYIICGLFVFAWFLALFLILDTPKVLAPVLAILAVPLFWLIIGGAIAPVQMGAFLVVSFLVSGLVSWHGVLRKPSQTFLKLR